MVQEISIRITTILQDQPKEDDDVCFSSIIPCHLFPTRHNYFLGHVGIYALSLG